MLTITNTRVCVCVVRLTVEYKIIDREYFNNAFRNGKERLIFLNLFLASNILTRTLLLSLITLRYDHVRSRAITFRGLAVLLLSTNILTHALVIGNSETRR